MSKPSEASGLATFRRNGSADSTGDARYTLDPDAGDVERFGERGQPVVVIPIGDGHVVRKTMPRNLYVPSDEADDSVESFTLRVELDSIQRAKAKPTAKPSAGVIAEDPVYEDLKAAGDVDALAAHIAELRGANRPAKKDRLRAEAIINAHNA